MEGDAQSSGLGICEFHQTLEIYWKLVFEEVRNLLFSVIKGDEGTLRSLVCFEAIARELNDVSNNRLKCADVPGIRLPFHYTSKNNLREIHISRTTTKDFFSVPLFTHLAFDPVITDEI